MKKVILLIIYLVVYNSVCFAQNAVVKGVLLDTINQINLAGVPVTLLWGEDSVLCKITHSNAAGFFEFKKIVPGNYLLLIKCSGYENYTDHLQLNEASDINKGNISMILKPINLKEVTVRQVSSAVKISGDTTEFNASNFRVPEGASVEEMLKELPGIQINKDGTINIMGQKVNKVLVDGEKFFGNDPTIATQNLPANAIYKVQVFDRKSDPANFTGIDDGIRTKTINLQLKKGRKKGSFGKLGVGAGGNGKFNNSGMINRFSNKIKLSAYGTTTNTELAGANLQQGNQELTDGATEFITNSGGIGSIINQGNDFDNAFSYGEGLPVNWAGGINYANIFNSGQQSINGSYRYNKMTSAGNSRTLSQSILPDTVFFNSESNTTFSSRQNHTVNGTYEWQIDNSTSIKFKADGYTAFGNNFSTYRSESQNKIGKLVNTGMRNITGAGNDQKLLSSVLIKRKFKKKGRTFLLSVSQNYGENNTAGFLYSLSSFFDKNGIISLRDTTDQKKANRNVFTSLNSRLTYTEPLSTHFFAELDYSHQASISNTQRLSFDRTENTKYEIINNIFSSHFKFKTFTNIAGIAFKYNGKKLIFSFGNKIAKSVYSQNNLQANSLLNRHFTNFFPRAAFTYKVSANRNLSITYNGYSRQPSANQLQPNSDNSNPLNILTGNPFLQQEFDHRVNFNYNSFNPARQQGLFIYGAFSLLSNAIVTSSFTDALGRTVNQYVNANGNYSLNSGFSYFISSMKSGVNLNSGLNFSKSNYCNLVNGKNNIAAINTAAVSLGINRNDEKKYNFYYYGSFRYNISTSSVRKDIKTKYWSHEHNLSLTVLLTEKFELNNELQSSLQQKTNLFGESNNLFLWNASFGKRILKNGKGIIKIIAHDILNQNNGYSRFISSNVIQEKNYQSIARYFLLSFVCNFKKNAG